MTAINNIKAFGNANERVSVASDEKDLYQKKVINGTSSLVKVGGTRYMMGGGGDLGGVPATEYTSLDATENVALGADSANFRNYIITNSTEGSVITLPNTGGLPNGIGYSFINSTSHGVYVKSETGYKTMYVPAGKAVSAALIDRNTDKWYMNNFIVLDYNHEGTENDVVLEVPANVKVINGDYIAGIAGGIQSKFIDKSHILLIYAPKTSTTTQPLQILKYMVLDISNNFEILKSGNLPNLAYLNTSTNGAKSYNVGYQLYKIADKKFIVSSYEIIDSVHYFRLSLINISADYTVTFKDGLYNLTSLGLPIPYEYYRRNIFSPIVVGDKVFMSFGVTLGNTTTTGTDANIGVPVALIDLADLSIVDKGHKVFGGFTRSVHVIGLKDSAGNSYIVAWTAGNSYYGCGVQVFRVSSKYSTSASGVADLLITKVFEKAISGGYEWGAINNIEFFEQGGYIYAVGTSNYAGQTSRVLKFSESAGSGSWNTSTGNILIRISDKMAPNYLLTPGWGGPISESFEYNKDLLSGALVNDGGPIEHVGKVEKYLLSDIIDLSTFQRITFTAVAQNSLTISLGDNNFLELLADGSTSVLDNKIFTKIGKFWKWTWENGFLSMGQFELPFRLYVSLLDSPGPDSFFIIGTNFGDTPSPSLCAVNFKVKKKNGVVTRIDTTYKKLKV